jgi:hypothetical protein
LRARRGIAAKLKSDVACHAQHRFVSRGPLLYFMGAACRLPIGRQQLCGKGERMADDDVQAELARLRAENEALKQRRNSAISMKVSEKGAVSVYGLGRFPVTLYQEQWRKLLASADEIKTFIEENRAQLKVKE